MLSSFDNLYYYVPEYDENNEYLTDKAYRVPISFGNYEKSVKLQDQQLTESMLKSGNFNFVPRMVLSFDGLQKNFERATQKYQRFKKKVIHPNENRYVLDMSYNSIPYDFQYTLLLQTRGMTMASQLTEQILSYFNPSYSLQIIEFPLFFDFTHTQILTDDPEFEIIDEFEDTQVNIVNVSFTLTVRSNIYTQIEYQAPIEVVKMFTHVWDDFNYKLSQLSRYYKFDVQGGYEGGYITHSTERVYDGTMPYDDTVELNYEEMMENRPDFNPPELHTDYDDITVRNTRKEI
jgi:hypothetical protein